VGLSASATLRRVKRLEDSGVIAGYVALLAPERVGLGLTAYINVRLTKHTALDQRSPMETFTAAVQAWPEVVECAALTGEMDYLLRVLVRDMAHFSRFPDGQPAQAPRGAGLQDQLHAAAAEGHHGRAAVARHGLPALRPATVFMICVGVGAGQPASRAVRTMASLVSK
jgi:Lrp/AsnC family leucine-responsive transcriptional regulator